METNSKVRSRTLIFSDDKKTKESNVEKKSNKYRNKIIITAALIGMEGNTCLYWLHTHKTDGIIHIEAPKSRDFSLGEFFDIWKSTSTGLPSTNENPTIYVNGQIVTSSLKDTMLNAHDEIVLVYGNTPSYIPRFYQFPEGL